MTDQATVFDGEAKPQKQEPTSPAPAAQEEAVNPQLSIPDPVKEWVGEGKKYKDLETALASIPAAQTHISTIEQENQRMKEMLEQLQGEVEKRKSLEDVLGELKQKPAEQPTQQAQAVDPSQFESLIDRRLQEREAKRKQQENIEAVKAKLSSAFGENAKDKYVQKAQELGVGLEWLNATAATSPNAVYALFPELKGTQEAPPRKFEPTHNSDTPPSTPTPTFRNPLITGNNKDLMALWKSLERTN